MEPPGEPPDRDSSHSNQSLANYSGKVSLGEHSITEKLSRPMAFDKMERLVTEMQHEEIGVPVRSQKLFLTSIPSAFMGYDLIEWMMERLTIEESEALSIANQLCLHGYFFPVNDTKSLVVKDDSSLYRFQARYYWPWQCKAPDNLEYAIYLTKRTLRNKQRHGLEEYEVEALASLNKNLRAKWPLVTLQSGEELKLSKDRKKGDKIIGDSQERAFWRVHRPPPGQFTPLEPCPVPSRDRQGKPRKRTPEDLQREVDYLKSSLGRTRMKMSQACESLITYCETFSDYDFFIQSVLPSNPWVTDDITFWQLNNTIVDIPTEKRVKRWAISIEELVSDPTGLQEFTAYLRKEYSHENIRFWIAVNDLRRSAHSQISRKVKEIYEEFLEPGAPCEINIDGKTMEKFQQGLKSPCRFTFDAASEHIYALLLKKDCYPRFVRSEHYKSLIATGIQPSHKKRFFGFGVPKKKSSTAPPIQALLTQVPGPSNMTPAPGSLARRRGSDRSLGSAHELAVCTCIKDGANKVPHSHSQSNLSDIPYSVVIYRGDMPSPGDAMEDSSLTSTATGVHDANLKNPSYVGLTPRWARGMNRIKQKFFCTGCSPYFLLTTISSRNRRITIYLAFETINHKFANGVFAPGDDLVYLVAMEPPGEPPDRDSSHSNQSLANYSGKVSLGEHSITEKLSRPMAFDKMERLVTEMQHEEIGVPVRSQKLFLTSIPSAFMGYDLIEWMMERLTIEESEALSIANQLCLHGYFFPVNDTKSLVVKDDSSLYRFQARYYWPWQCKAPDNLEYAIYLTKRTLRNKQRHGLEEYEVEALASLNKNLRAKWPLVTLQSGEELKLSKDRKKGDKIIGDSQERAFWRVHRPPPGQFTPLEPCPVPSRDRQGKPRKRTPEDLQREVDYLKSSLGRTRMKMSQACESLITYCETFSDYDFFIQSVLPSNPWVTDDITFWQLNNTIVDIPTEKRVKRWAISIEELVSDPTGLQEFTAYLRKEYSHENIRFWIAVNDLRRSAHSQISRKVKEIYEEFLEPGAPCEINIDGKTMEKFQQGLKSPCRFTFDAASEHIYALLLKKDCYPRFVRSEHYKSLIATGIQPSHKKRFFGFGVPKKKSSTAPPIQALLTQVPGPSNMTPAPGSLARRRGSDRSLGSAHELAVCTCIKDGANKVPHSHSQSNLSDIPYSVVIYRGDMPSPGDAMEDSSLTSTATGVHDANLKNPEGPKIVAENLGSDIGACAVCPWEMPETVELSGPTVSVSVCPWETDELPQTSDTKSRKDATADIANVSADINEVSDRMRRSCGLRQSTLDFDLFSHKKLAPGGGSEQRRASMTIPPRLCDLQFSFRQQNSESPPNQSPISPKKCERPNTSQMTLSFTKTISFDNREEFQQENSIKISSDEIVSDKFPKEHLIDTHPNDAIPKTIQEKRELNLVRSSECDNLVIETALCDPINQPIIIDTSANVSLHGTAPTINVVCPVGESDTKSMDLDNDNAVADNRIPDNFNTNLTDEKCIPQEELSPTTDEYQECCPPADYQYDIPTEGEILAKGCIAPHPTPAPSLMIAPLAEVEVEDELETEEMESIQITISGSSETNKNVDRKASDSNLAKKDVVDTQCEESQCRNAVCPWEDEDVTSDAPFVKTYATLGYL